jgi:hypothetical protein
MKKKKQHGLKRERGIPCLAISKINVVHEKATWAASELAASANALRTELP